MDSPPRRPDVLDVACGSRRALERDGLVERAVVAGFPPHVRYRLTPLGGSLAEPLGALCRWAEEHMTEVEAHRARVDDGGGAGDR